MMNTISELTFFVPGKPVPQGSKRYVGNGIMVESSKAIKPWRADVKYAAHQQMCERDLLPFGYSVSVDLMFVMPRPKTCPKSRTPDAVKRPDIDKLCRAVLDALKDTVWGDDSQVVALRAHKRLAEPDERPGLHATVKAWAG